ncbi:uncharacterized protein LOC132735162 [Ruditapes philippinarum]|uniref:uncharacterized protein LOC132735162 n=1 Tax=Ruditapes philippinarum TaxID=129788 RepID=UPI00295C1D7A|nr:uncharacterized protein LOC132735162 [Ruditapes philippinarum]
MELNERILFYCVLSTVLKDVFGELQCSHCLSNGKEGCAVTPSPAEPCSKYRQRKGPMNCMIAKITNSSGSIIQFLRGCTGLWTSSGCINQSDTNTELCYDICSTNNCNSANRFRRSCIIYPITVLLYAIVTK